MPGEALLDISPRRLPASARCMLRMVKSESFAGIPCLHSNIARISLIAIPIILAVGILCAVSASDMVRSTL